MELRPYFEWRGLGFISHSALRVRDELRDLRRRADLRGARRPGRRPEGLPVRRGAQGRAQAVGVQGVRHRLHAGDADRHLHGLPGGRLRRLLQLRPVHPAAGEGGDHGREHRARRPGRRRSSADAGAGTSAAARRADERSGAAEPSDREEQVLERIDRARGAARPRVKEERITLAHGAGGKATQTLIEAVFLEAFRNPLLEPLEDQAVLRGRRRAAGVHHRLVRGLAAVLPRRRHRRPGRQRHRQRPGGLPGPARCTCRPASSWRRASPSPTCGRIVASMAGRGGRGRRAGRHRRHQGGAAGQGRRLLHQHRGRGGAGARRDPGGRDARPGDAVLVSGPIGDHGVTIMLARGELDIEADLAVRHRAAARPGRRAARRRPPACAACATPPAGGVATILNEVAPAAGRGRRGRRGRRPGPARGARRVRDCSASTRCTWPARAGWWSWSTAPQADAALAALRAHPLGDRRGRHRARSRTTRPALVLLKTAFGGTRIVDMLVGDPLPRIC